MFNICRKNNRRNIHLQFGLFRYEITFNGNEMEELLEMAADVVLRTYPHLSRSGLVDNVILFKHTNGSSQQLEHVNSIDALAENDTIQIVRKVNVGA